MQKLTASYIKKILPVRSAQSNKGSYGKLLCVCGAKDMMGAAVLSVNAAYSAGAGYVCAAVPAKEKDIIFKTVPEALALPLHQNETAQIKKALKDIDYTAMLYGCGLGGRAAKLFSVIKTAKIPLVVDGDGLNTLAKQKIKFKTPVILTPHPLEAARLLGLSGKEIAQDNKTRVKWAQEISAKYNAVCVLKGRGTVVCYADKVFINPTGGSALAKAGSGDVLAGITAGFFAQLLKQQPCAFTSALNAACAGVYIHGLCGDLAAGDFTDYAVMPSNLNKYIGKALKKVL